METPLEEAPAEKARRLKALGAKLLAPLRRFASLSRRTLGLIAVVLLGASVIGWGAWFQYREGRGPGPSFSHLNRLEEFLYAPLGVPLREDVGRDLLSQGCFSEDLSASLETAPEFAALSKELSEPAVGGGDSPGSADISPSVRFFALEGNGVFALFEHKETPPLLRLLQVEGRHVPVKWGLREIGRAHV